MSPACSDIQRRIEEEGATDPAVGTHLTTCRACQAHAALVAQLDSLTPAAADDERVASIMAALPLAAWQRRRFWTWLPAAAGFLLAAVGLVLVGALPAPTVLGSLPHAAGTLLGWLSSHALDTLVAAQSGSDALQTVAAAGGLGLVIWILLTLLGGGWAVMALVRRGRSAR